MARKRDTEKPKLTKDSWRKARRIISYLRPYKWIYFTSLFFLLLTSLASMVFPYLMGQLFDSSSQKSEFDLGNLENTQSIVTILFIVFAAQSIFSFFRIYLTSIVTENVLKDIRNQAYEKLITLPISFFNKNKTGELTSRISADITQLQDTFNTILAEFLRQFIVIIIGLTLLALISIKLVLIMLATVPVMAIVAVFFGRFIKKISKEAQDKVAESTSIVEETLTAIASVKAYANEYLEVIRYKKATNEVKNLAMKGAMWRGVFVSFIIFCMFGAIIIVLWQGVVMKGAGEITNAQLIAFIMYSIFIGASFGSIPELYAQIQKAIGATERLMDIIDEKGEDISTTSVRDASRLLGIVRFDEVSFHYENRADLQVLNKISFEIQPGMQVAIVGPSGAGKSTIASLLLRFYEPTSGQILYDGIKSNEIGLTQLRSQIGLVPQEVILFGGSIRENIAYGKPGADDEEIVNAARKANALEFIEKFPEKLETVVGERGVQLSGGQRQRIAIARAILKDPSILILDEATSSLDSESERLVQDALEKLMAGRTSFVIAHRLSTVKNADLILVLEDGRVVEKGKHMDLIALEKGLYKRLSSLQFVE